MGAQHGSAAAAAHRSRSRAASPTCLHAGLCSGMSQSKCPIRARDWDTQAVGRSRALCAARRRWEVSTRSRRGVRTAREDIEQRERGQAWDKHHGGRAAPRGRPAARDKRHAAEQGGNREGARLIHRDRGGTHPTVWLHVSGLTKVVPSEQRFPKPEIGN